MQNQRKNKFRNKSLLLFLILSYFPFVSKGESINSNLSNSSSLNKPIKKELEFPKYFSKSKLKKFECFANELINYLNIPGAAIAIVDSKGVLFQKVYGVKKIGEKDKINNDTIFRIGSISKSLTGYLIYKLSKKGLNLEDPISKYLPNIIIHNKEFTKNIELKHILSHSVGVENHCLEKIAYVNQSPLDLYKKLDKVKKICSPGEKFHYQNVIFSLISPLLENAFNKSFKQLMEAEILKPLKLENTILTEKKYKESLNIANPHCKIQNKFKCVNPKSYYYNILASGGISSSIEDMSKFLQTLLIEIDKDSSCIDFFFNYCIDASYKIKILENRDYNDKIYPRIISWKYGLGWYKENYAGNDFIFHGGRLTGFRSIIMFSPSLRIGIILLINSSEGRLISILRHYFADILLGLDPLTVNEIKQKIKLIDK